MSEIQTRARSIESIADIEKIIASPRYSFTELMECIEIASRFENWVLRHKLAELAFQIATGSNKVVEIETAAREVVMSCMKLGSTVESLSPLLERAKSFLENWNADKPSYEKVRTESLNSVSELLLLINDPSVESRVRLSSRLRKFERSDLAIDIATSAIKIEQNNSAALVTLSSAYLDEGLIEEARKRIGQALKVNPNDGIALVVASRVEQESGNPKESLLYAKSAYLLAINRYSAHRLLAAAVIAKDTDAFEDARKEIASIADETEDADPWYLTLAIRVLIERGKLDDADRAIQEIVKSKPTGRLNKQIASLKNDLRKARKDQNPKLF